MSTDKPSKVYVPDESTRKHRREILIPRHSGQPTHTEETGHSTPGLPSGTFTYGGPYKVGDVVDNTLIGPSAGKAVPENTKKGAIVFVGGVANPKQAYGDKKVPLHLVPPVAIAYMGMALKEGAKKYGPYNWRENNVEVMTYIGAAMRHIGAYVDGEDTDPESGNPHLSHALASLAILVDAVEGNTAIDNRPLAGAVPRVLEDAAK